MSALAEPELAYLITGLPQVVYLLAWDNSGDNPNPHPWDLDTTEYETFEAACAAAEAMVADEDDPNWNGHWLVVTSVAS